MQIIYKSVDEIKPYPNNPRNNDNAVDAVAASIEEFGFKQPIIIDANNEIIAGHTRLKAAKKLGYEDVPCILADDLTPEQVKAYRLVDNKVAEFASWNFEMLDSELVNIDDIDMDMFGNWGLEEIDFGNLDQYTDEENSEEYGEFIEKFKPKKTTDDCFTPAAVYEAVKNWAINEYGIPDDAEIIRPFYPGGDYEKYEYPDGCVVIDNPPFSILAEIKRFYHERNIKYFLFAPHLTLFASNGDERYIVTDSDIIYENGAKVTTSFVTNMDKYKIRTAPKLAEAIDRAVEEGREKAPELPTYDYPLEVVTAARLAKIARVEFRVLPEYCHFTRQLDAQKETGAGLYGAGYLIAEKAAAEKAAAEKAAAKEVQVWELSPREREIVRKMGKVEIEKTIDKVKENENIK